MVSNVYAFSQPFLLNVISISKAIVDLAQQHHLCVDQIVRATYLYLFYATEIHMMLIPSTYHNHPFIIIIIFPFHV